MLCFFLRVNVTYTKLRFSFRHINTVFAVVVVFNALVDCTNVVPWCGGGGVVCRFVAQVGGLVATKLLNASPLRAASLTVT